MQFLEVAQVLKNDHSALITLAKTKKIEPADLTDPRWAAMKAMYDANQGADSAIRALITIANSLLFQERRHFVVTGKTAQAMVRNDANWKKKESFKTSRWSEILRLAYGKDGELGLFKKNHAIQVGVKTRTLYSVVDPTMLSLLAGVDNEAQLAASLAFINTIRDEGSRKGSPKGIQSLDNRSLDSRSLDPQTNRPQTLGVCVGVKEGTDLAVVESQQSALSTESNDFIELCGLAFRLCTSASDTYRDTWASVLSSANGAIDDLTFPDKRRMSPDLISNALSAFRAVTSSSATTAEQGEGIARWIECAYAGESL